jgi:hypothetical protein
MCICQLKKFSGVIPLDPIVNGREGKKEGGIGRNGKNRMGRNER